MPIYSRFYEKDFTKHYTDIMYNWEWTDYNDFLEKYGWATNLEAYASWMTVMTYFHCVGTLLKRKRIDPTLVDDLIQTTTVLFWEKIESIVKELRKRLNFPRAYWAVEYLYDEMKRMEQLATASR